MSPSVCVCLHQEGRAGVDSGPHLAFLIRGQIRDCPPGSALLPHLQQFNKHRLLQSLGHSCPVSCPVRGVGVGAKGWISK